MYWYNPIIREMENAPEPLTDAQAIEMLRGHPNSDEFIQEYRRWRATRHIVEALIYTGHTFQMRDQGLQPPE